MSLMAVRIVQNRAPSELIYAVPSRDVDAFLASWREQNPERCLHAQVMPLIQPVDAGRATWEQVGTIPVEYP